MVRNILEIINRHLIGAKADHGTVLDVLVTAAGTREYVHVDLAQLSGIVGHQQLGGPSPEMNGERANRLRQVIERVGAHRVHVAEGSAGIGQAKSIGKRGRSSSVEVA